MRKGIIIGIICVAILAVAGLALAETQSVKVGGDLKFSGISRSNWSLRETGEGIGATNDDTRENLMSQIRLSVAADLTDNVSTYIRLINERDWTGETVANTDIDLDLGYVTLKEFFYAPITATVGRQELHFGNDFIMGDPDTNQLTTSGAAIVNGDLSERKGFDAARVTLNYNPWTMDLVFAKIQENSVFLWDDDTLYGGNVRYDFCQYNAIWEGYAWYRGRSNNSNNLNDVARTTKNDDSVITIGGRGQIEPVKDLVLSLEAAHQMGHYGARQNLTSTQPIGSVDNGTNPTEANWDDGADRNAYALQAGAVYGWSKQKYTPRLQSWYSYYSGDEANRTGNSNYTGWDPMFENQSIGIVANALFAQSNCHAWKTIFDLNPIEDLNASISYSAIWLASNLGVQTIPRNSMYRRYTDQNRFLVTDTKTDTFWLGSEWDLCLKYDYTEDVQLALDSGMFIPGAVMGDQNRETAYSVVGSMKVSF